MWLELSLMLVTPPVGFLLGQLKMSTVRKVSVSVDEQMQTIKGFIVSFKYLLNK